MKRASGKMFTKLSRSACRFLPWRCLTRRILLIWIVLSCSSVFIYNRWAVTKNVLHVATQMFTKEETFSGYLVDTKQCQIPNIDPFDPAIKKYIRVTHWEPCASRPSLTYQDGDMLRLNWTVIKNYYQNSFSLCKYYPIVRDSVNDRTYHILKQNVPFRKDITVEHEFLKVVCFDKNHTVIYTNYYAYILRVDIAKSKSVTKVNKMPVKLKPSILSKTKLRSSLFTTPSPSKIRTATEIPISEVKSRLNVLLVGVDSMSRLNFMRQMSRTRSYLLDEMGAFDMSGYNKVADNTFVNLVPILCGKYVEELPWNETLNKKPFDKYEFLWNRYKKHGYATLYAEDSPSIATFNYLKSGFKRQPTDHYYRPFALAMEHDSKIWSADSHCIRDRMETEMVLQYTYDFARVYKDKKYFGLSFIGRLTHDDINKAGRGDLVYLKFFQRLKQENLLQDTMLVFFSDHGIRFGNFRKTYIGKIEERLPFMFVVPPRWLVDRYPNLWGNLKVNTHRLTTPFDFHETLVEALDIETAAALVDKQIRYGIPIKKKRAYSLFTRVPYERTCDDASILTHWCSCHQRTPIDVNNGKVIRAAEDVVKKMNRILKVEKKCAVLNLNKIVDASVIGANEELLRFEASVNDVIDRQVYFGKPVEMTNTDYQLTIETAPGLAHLEASIRHNPVSETYTLLGSVSRTNKIGSQADCIDDIKLKKYCYCSQDAK